MPYRALCLLHLGLLSLLAAALTAAPACGGDLGGEGLGGTPGGAQDIGYFRATVWAGGVPHPEDVLTEGLLSEHDLPAEGPACDQVVCLRPATAWADDLSRGRRVHWAFLGMQSGLPAEGFVRPALDVAVVVDTSDLMSIDMVETRQALHNLVDALRPDDRLAIVDFDAEANLVQPLAVVADASEFHATIAGLDSSGGWNLGAGVEAGYDVLADAGAQDGRMRRVMVFSCGYPNGADGFSSAVQDGAADGIGMSFFGVLLGHDPALADLLGTQRGGSYHYLENLEHVEQLFVEDFDTMVTPLAYDFALTIETEDGAELLSVDGVPGLEIESPRVDVATVFAHRGGGGIVTRFDGDPNQALAQVGFDYDPEPALGWSAHHHQEEAVLASGAGGPTYATVAAHKAVFLVNQAEQMSAACAAYHASDRATARAILDTLLDWMQAQQTSLGDAALDVEIALVAKLRQNVH